MGIVIILSMIMIIIAVIATIVQVRLRWGV